MSIMYTLIFTFMAIEAAVLLFFLLPLPLSMRTNALDLLSTNAFIQKIVYGAKIGFLLVGIAFLDALRVVQRESTHSHEEDVDLMSKKGGVHMHGSCEHVKNLFRAQRNLYLTGFTLFLGLVLYRFFGTLLDLHKNEKKAVAVTKQAEGAKKEYDRLLDEVAKKDAKIKEMLDKEEELVKENKTAKAEFEAMKRQSKGLTDGRIGISYAACRRQLKSPLFVQRTTIFQRGSMNWNAKREGADPAERTIECYYLAYRRLWAWK